MNGEDDIFRELDMLQEGSDRTMLSLSVVNPMLAKINALINLRGEGGCRVVRAQGNFVITTDGL